MPPFGKRELLTRKKRATYKALLIACGGGIDQICTMFDESVYKPADPSVSFADSSLSQRELKRKMIL